MKRLLILFFCLIFALTAAAQNYSTWGARVYDGQDQKLSRSSVKSLFQGTPAYNEYVTGIKYSKLGNGLLWPGVAISAIGLWSMALTALVDAMGECSGECAPSSYWKDGGGFVCLGIALGGAALIATGATFKIKGKKRVASAVGMYNDYMNSSAGRHVPELSLGITRGGLGLVCTF